MPVFLIRVADESVPALQQAMRAALVRATGRPGSATDPVFAALVAQAQKYVVNYQRGPQGQLQVAFNGAEVDQVINGLGRSVWSADRPFTLIVLSPAPPQSEFQADHQALQQAAQALGLPISIMPLSVTDASGHLLPRQALLALVHRFGAQQLLVGRPPPQSSDRSSPPGAIAANTSSGAAAPPQVAATSPAGGTPAGGAAVSDTSAPAAAPWRWTLITPFIRRSFTGPVTAGIDGTVALLAPPPASSADRSAQVRLRINNVSTLADYAHIELVLAAIPGVSRADVSEVRGDTAVFALQARGGGPGLARMLSGSSRFSRVRATGGALTYRYRPPPAASSTAQPSTTEPSAAQPSQAPPSAR